MIPIARICFSLMLVLAVSACASTSDIKMKMTTQSVDPGTSVSMQGKSLRLLGEPLRVGKALPSVELVDAMTMKPVDLSKEKGNILLLSVVVSTDTPVCEEQTHYLGEQGSKLPASVKRIVISRDTPFAQKRFAKEAHLENLQYLSDYKTGAFGQATGLLIENILLLARAVIVVDRLGIVRYIQVTPAVASLPDMDAAFAKAAELASSP
ncbi:MAG TPA: redoxin family protein [Syntrophales bacterium]|nr:redoxin family protein [Syntrophales bacterium]